MLAIAAIVILASVQVKELPFNPTGAWKARYTFNEKGVEAGTPESIKQQLRDSVKEQNAKPQTIVFQKDHTYTLNREIGTWKVEGKKLWLTATKQGIMKVAPHPQKYDIARGGTSFGMAVNKVVRVDYTRAPLKTNT